MFVNSFIKGLPQCKVAHSIRQSYLYKKNGNNDVNSDISKRYPLPYYYIRKQYISSFYYNKNNLIAYYIHSSQNNDFHAIPLYNYLNNDYEIALSNFPYNFPYHHEVCLVRAPNRRVYICAGNIIGNVSKGTLLHKFINVTSPWFLSMPIANSFFLAVAADTEEIVIYIIELIKERKHVQKYPTKEIIGALLSSLKPNDRGYKAIESIKKIDRLSFRYGLVGNIEKDANNLVFYNRYVVNMTLYFSSANAGGIVHLSVVATFQNKELTVSLQINDKLSIKTPFYNYEVDLGSSIVLTNNSYKLDDKYDISHSHLYSVIASIGDYTIISEPNQSRDKVTLYYKNEPSPIFFSILPLDIDNFEDILFIRLHNKLLVSVIKDNPIKPNEESKYYIRYNNSNVDIIDTKVIRNLITNIMHENDNKKLAAIDLSDITNIVKHVRLKDKLVQALRSYDSCSSDDVMLLYYGYYIDHDEEEVYALIYFTCLKRLSNEWPEHSKSKIYLFRCKISDLIGNRTSFKLVRKFEFDTNKYISSIIANILNNREIIGEYGKILRFLSKKWNTGNAFTDLKIFEMCDKSEGYYDFEYNRMSIKVSPTNTSITSKLSLVRRILPMF